MSKKLHIATLGLHANERIRYVITKKGADKIALIYDETTNEEMMKFKEFYSEGNIPFITKKVEPWNYRNILAGILQVIAENPKYTVEYNVSCGTRIMSAAAHRAALITDSVVYFVIGDYGEPLGEIAEVQPVSVTVLTEPKRNILRKIADQGGSINSQKQLGSRTELKVASISRHLRDLDESGYIIRKRKGRENFVELTDLGEIILKVKQYKRGQTSIGEINDFDE